MVAKRKLKNGRKGTTGSGARGNYYELMSLLPGEVWLHSGNSKTDGRAPPGVEPAGQFLNYYELMILLPGEVWLQSGNSKNGRKGTTGSGARGN